MIHDLPKTWFDVMYQDEYWITRDQVILLIGDMDPRHRDNLLPWLERNSEKLNQQCWKDLLMKMRLWGDSDAADDAFDQILDELAASDWLDRTPLVKRLRRYAEERTALGRLQTRIHNATYPIRKVIRAR